MYKSQEKKKIVIINQSTGYLTIDVINCFANEFDQVDLIYGTMTEEKYPLDKRVRRTRVMKKTRKSNIGRFFRWAIASVQIHFLLLTKFRKHEILYYSLPPFAYLGALMLNRKFSIVIFDVYPDAFRIAGINENNLIFKFWAWANKKVFSRAHRVYTIAESLKNKLLKYANEDKIKVIPLWTSLSGIDPIPKDQNIFAKQHGFQDKFVVQYSGNIGQNYNVEILIRLAEELQDKHDIQFVIIGRGTKVPGIEKLVEQKKISNITILPFQPLEILPHSLSNADIGVVMLDIADMSFPSKTFNMMSVGSVILGIASKESELNQFIEKHEIGACIPESDFDGIKKYILTLYQDKVELEKIRMNSIKASQFFTEKNAKLLLNNYLEYN